MFIKSLPGRHTTYATQIKLVVRSIYKIRLKEQMSLLTLLTG